MDQGSYQNKRKQEFISDQGRFGENNATMESASWICPNCETINTEDNCVLCGYTKEKPIPPKKKQWKNIVIALIAILAVTAGVLFAIPNGWQNENGKLYYYTWGRKITGKAEINGVEYYFSENGAERVSKFIVIRNHAVGETNPEYVEFQLDNGNKTWETPRLLLTPVDQCTYMHVNLEITNNIQGNGDGKWQLSVCGRNDKKEWIHLAVFEVNKGKGECIVELVEPISLGAFVCTRIENDSWSGQTRQKLSEIRYIE